VPDQGAEVSSVSGPAGAVFHWRNEFETIMQTHDTIFPICKVNCFTNLWDKEGSQMRRDTMLPKLKKRVWLKLSELQAESSNAWSGSEIEDLRYSLQHGDTLARAAKFLRRREDEVRRKAEELGLQQGRPKWPAHPFLAA
jgi:hypothetical protein